MASVLGSETHLVELLPGSCCCPLDTLQGLAAVLVVVMSILTGLGAVSHPYIILMHIHTNTHTHTHTHRHDRLQWPACTCRHTYKHTDLSGTVRGHTLSGWGYIKLYSARGLVAEGFLTVLWRLSKGQLRVQSCLVDVTSEKSLSLHGKCRLQSLVPIMKG